MDGGADGSMKTTGPVHVGETIRARGGTTLLPRGGLSLEGPKSLLVAGRFRGAYDLSGDLVSATCRHWGKNDYCPDKMPKSLEAKIEGVEDEEVVWGGAIVGHYGHFLTESVARLWAVLDGGPKAGTPIVFVAPQDKSTGHEWLAGFGGQRILLSAEETRRFTRVFIPDPAWQLNGWLAPEMRDVHLRVRDGIVAGRDPCTSEDGKRMIWLSRSQQPADRRPYDEALLEWILKDHVRIVKPEALPLADQIGAFESCDLAAGVVGSAFHTLLMAKEMPACVYICPERVRDAFVAQSSMLRATATFAHGLAAADSSKWEKPRSLGAMRVLIPETLRTLGRSGLEELRADRSVSALCEPERDHGCEDREGMLSPIAKVCLDPQSIEARLQLGLGFERLGEYDCALEQFRYCVEFGVGDPRPSFYAARTLARSGKPEEAATMAGHALKLDPTFEAARRFVGEAES